MADLLPGATDDAYIAADLNGLINIILSGRFLREDNAEMQVGKLLVDTHWSQKNILVKQICRRHPQYPARLFPAQGYGSSALRPELNALALKEGTQNGLQWRIAPPDRNGGDRWLLSPPTGGSRWLPVGWPCRYRPPAASNCLVSTPASIACSPIIACLSGRAKWWRKTARK
jgi:hypothetical protein